MNSIYTEGIKFRDEEGNERIFNGVNLVNKGKLSFGKRKYKFEWKEKEIKNLKELGFNIIRLGVIWGGVEPEPGKYDETYLREIDKIVARCEKYEIYFFLDIHQDLYGEKSKIGDGAPPWACLSGDEKFKKALFVWAEGYFYGRATGKCFDAFWNNEKYEGRGLQDYYCNMVKYLAERYSKSPAYFGFDFMNEPFPGTAGHKVFTELVEAFVNSAEKKAGVDGEKFEVSSCFGGKREKTGFLMLMGKTAKRLANRKKLLALREVFASKKLFHEGVMSGADVIKDFDLNCYSPFINKCAEAVREVTDKGMVLMENSYYSNLGIPYSAPAVTVSGERERNLAFAPHGYDLFVDSPLYRYASNERTDSIFEEHRASQKRLNVPVIVGEWGGFSKGTKWLPHVDHLIEFFNNNNWSSVYWAYDKKIFKSPLIKSLVRPYPQKIGGDLISFSFDRKKGVFDMAFSAVENAETEIFLHTVPLDIETDCDYKIENYEKGETGTLILKGSGGEHKIKITF